MVANIKMTIAFVGLLVAIVVSGCEKQFNEAGFEAIRTGMTKEQVIRLIGPPNEMELNDRYFSWTYRVKKPGQKLNDELPSEEDETLEVFVAFGVDGLLTTITLTDEEIESVWPEGRPQIGMSRDEVQALLGPPADTRRSRFKEVWRYPGYHGVAFDDNERVFVKGRRG